MNWIFTIDFTKNLTSNIIQISMLSRKYAIQKLIIFSPFLSLWICNYTNNNQYVGLIIHLPFHSTRALSLQQRSIIYYYYLQNNIINPCKNIEYLDNVWLKSLEKIINNDFLSLSLYSYSLKVVKVLDCFRLGQTMPPDYFDIFINY